MASKYDKYLGNLGPQPNEFKVDNIPDNKSYLKDIELPDQTPRNNKYEKYLKPDIMDTNVYPKDAETEFGIGQAFLLGLGDSARGITQFAGGDEKLFGLFEMDQTLEEQL